MIMTLLYGKQAHVVWRQRKLGLNAGFVNHKVHDLKIKI